MLQQALSPVWRMLFLSVRFLFRLYFGHKFGHLSLSTAPAYRPRFIRSNGASHYSIQLPHGPFSLHAFQTQLERDHNQHIALSTNVFKRVRSIDEQHWTKCANHDLQQHKSRLFLPLGACMLATPARAPTSSLHVHLKMRTPRLHARCSRNLHFSGFQSVWPASTQQLAHFLETHPRFRTLLRMHQRHKRVSKKCSWCRGE